MIEEPTDPMPPGASTGGATWIMLAVLGWGLLLALGTYLFGGNRPVLRALIVACCTWGFLGLWLAALYLRRRRLDAEVDEDENAEWQGDDQG